jgi:hypothetical protein
LQSGRCSPDPSRPHARSDSCENPVTWTSSLVVIFAQNHI